MKVIVGLGNPGKAYARTPHNLGFEVVEELSRRHSAEFRFAAKEQADIAECRWGDEAVVLAKPMTFMNLSGQSVREILRNRPAELTDLMVLSDDVNLEIGRIRLRAEGSHGGQNGLRSIIECLGSNGFPRLRVGIRPNHPIDDLSRYVLSIPKPDDAKALREMIGVAADATEVWAREGIKIAANKFNGYAA